MNNPLFNKFDRIPFNIIETHHYLEAIKFGIDKAKQEIQEIKNNTDEPNFKNTIEALAYSGEQLSDISHVFFNLNSANTNPEMQKLAQEISPLLSNFRNDIALDEVLFRRIEKVYKNTDFEKLNEEQKTLLEKKYKGFTRNGVLLKETKKQKLREIDQELSKRSLQFGENLLAVTNHFELVITDPKDLDGIPTDVQNTAKAKALEKNKDNSWVFTLDYPSYVPFMKYAKNRTLREELHKAFCSRCFKNDAYDNQDNIINITKLRAEKSRLLGYKNYADYILEERMAKNVDTVKDFLEELGQKAYHKANKELQEIKDLAIELDNIKNIEPWDIAYYTEKLKEARYNFDDEILKPYFELNQTLQGVFDVSEKLYGLSFKINNDVDKYHPDIKIYDVLDNKGNFISLLYADFHPREGKRNGAWMTSYKGQQINRNGENERPHISIVCNFTTATKDKPALLSFNEVTTLFHEFGHALHGILANTQYSGLSGTNVLWDFVELPSQIFENWCYEKEALALFAKHYQTQETLPDIYIEKIKESSTFMEATATLRQVSFAMLDLQWHSSDLKNIKNVKEFEDQIMQKYSLFGIKDYRCMSTAFAHIFQGGYASGYYSYKWAEVLDADAFELFLEKGIFNTEVSMSFRENILEKGGTEDPMKLYENFRGKKPSVNALLKRAGLLVQENA